MDVKKGKKTAQTSAEKYANSSLEEKARIGNKPLWISVSLDHVGKKITVEDDGRGMDLDELEAALTIAKEKHRSKEKLGRCPLQQFWR